MSFARDASRKSSSVSVARGDLSCKAFSAARCSLVFRMNLFQNLH